MKQLAEYNIGLYVVRVTGTRYHSELWCFEQDSKQGMLTMKYPKCAVKRNER